MTASITVYVEEAANVLTVASKALHFTPDQNLLSNYLASLSPDGRPQKLPQMPAKAPMPSDSGMQTVWVKTAKDIHPAPVKIGIDDDKNAQVINGLKEGDEVLVSLTENTLATASNGQTSSPFMPKPPSANKKSSSTPPPPQQ